jgi:hypothetical protein
MRCEEIDLSMWEDPESIFYTTLAIACDVHTKRSGIFADPKKAILKQLEAGTSEIDIDSAIAKIVEPFQHYTTKEVHIQNIDGFKSKDLVKSKGDAEFTRVPYSITREIDPKYEQDIESVLGIKLKPGSSGGGTRDLSLSGSSSAELVEESHPILEMFKEHPGPVLDFVQSFFGSGDLSIEAMIDIICTARSISPKYKELILILTYEANINPTKLRDIIGALLTNWQDNVNGEVVAISLL